MVCVCVLEGGGGACEEGGGVLVNREGGACEGKEK